MKFIRSTLLLMLLFVLIALPAFAQTPISYGDNLSGAISVVGEKDEFTFYGTSGEVVDIRFAKTSGALSTYGKLYNPSGALMTTAFNQISTTLAATGTFKITIEDFGNTKTGNYNLNLQRRNNPVGAPTLNFGDTVSGTLNAFAKVLVYKFSVTANDTVLVNFAKLNTTSGTLDPYCELYNSSGAQIGSGTFSSPFTVNISYTGDVYIFVRDFGYDGAGSIEITLQRVNNPANPVALNFEEVREDTLDAITKVNAYCFDASAGQTVTLCSGIKSTTSGSLSLYMKLYDTAGTQLVDTIMGNFKKTFTNAGTYYLFIYNTYDEGTGIYKFILKNGDFSCISMDFVDPQVSLTKPTDGEVIENNSTYAITWTASDNVGITSQEIRFSTDGGVSYPTVIASGLGTSVRTYNWQVPADLISSQARIKVIAQDAQANQGYAANNSNFIIIKTALPADSKEINYEYDNLSRLIKSTSPEIQSTEYTYDALGNRLSLKTQDAEYRLSSMITADLNGNGKDEIIINFGPSYGIWIKYDDGSWSQLHNLSPKAMTAGDIDGDGLDDLVIDFGYPYGIWIRYGNGNWMQLHNISPKSMLIGNIDSNPKKDIIIDFGQEYGIWIYSNNSSWSNLHNVSADSIVTGDLNGDSIDDIIIDFGSTYGIWIKYSSGSWNQLHNLSPEFMACGNLDSDAKADLVINFGNPYGIWIYSNNFSWSQLHSISPENLIIADLDGDNKGDIIIDFGSTYGIWIKYSNGNWAQLHNLSPESIIGGDLDSNPKDDLVIDFGDAYGIWGYYNNSDWSQLHNLSP